MIKISRQEVLDIARISNLELRSDEVEPLMKQLEQVLSYAERVQEVAADIQEPSSKAVNVFREDVINRSDPEPLLAQAPEREGNYFVVPIILESSDRSSNMEG